MTLVQLVQMIGDILTTIDATLSRADFSPSDPNWQQIYALRKHLDDQQRELVTLSISLSDGVYKGVTDQISAANTEMTAVITNLSKVGDAINQIAKVAAAIDQVLQIAAAAAAV